MNNIVILDFNRTIYDPGQQALIPGARFVLRTLLRRGFRLYLVSRAGTSRRNLIKSLGIEQYFSRIVVAKEKRKQDFMNIVRSRSIARDSSFIVGDRVQQEIRIGNELGLQTVWVKWGKFAKEVPQTQIEKPTYTVHTWKEVLNVIYKPLIS
ncbi:MAG: HAD hydrolase-like protein [Candidatus Kerfeldbacteria bacterium]|nr:HAD hydrolase-like protein [Candidatus Kerfeldbacteria bacterium]